MKLNPRGQLAYHVELIGLVARCTEGIAPQAESLARALFSLGDLLEHVLLPELPIVLKLQYLRLLDEAYLFVKRSVKDVASSPEMARLIEAFSESIFKFTEETLGQLDKDFFENRDELEHTNYVLTSITMTMSLFRAPLPSGPRVSNGPISGREVWAHDSVNEGDDRIG